MNWRKQLAEQIEQGKAYKIGEKDGKYSVTCGSFGMLFEKKPIDKVAINNDIAASELLEHGNIGTAIEKWEPEQFQPVEKTTKKTTQPKRGSNVHKKKAKKA